jgi:transcriptional regulator GlxA family with amidase domain
MSEAAAELVRLVDRLEEDAAATGAGYLTLEVVERAAGRALAAELADALLLVDYRRRADGSPVVQCRLNRQHPLVRSLSSW